MITFEQLISAKEHFASKAHYFTGVEFKVLASDFTLATEMMCHFEELMKENMELKARVQALEELIQPKEIITDAAPAADCEAPNI